MSLSNLRVLCTGNPNNTGLAKEVLLAFPNAVCLHRSMGVDLRTQEGIDYFTSAVKNCDVFVNISRIEYGIQERLLRIAHEEMKGHVFNIGSIAEYERWEWYDPSYTNEKRQLRETSLALCTEQFKTTHIVVGGFQDYADNSPHRMDPKEIVNVIKFVLESPVNIPIIGIEKIIDKEMEEHLNGKLHTTR